LVCNHADVWIQSLPWDCKFCSLNEQKRGAWVALIGDLPPIRFLSNAKLEKQGFFAYGAPPGWQGCA
jgi:hypothetical protein